MLTNFTTRMANCFMLRAEVVGLGHVQAGARQVPPKAADPGLQATRNCNLPGGTGIPVRYFTLPHFSKTTTHSTCGVIGNKSNPLTLAIW